MPAASAAGINLKYVPDRLTWADKRRQVRELRRSRRLYKRGEFHTRSKVKSYPHHTSKHVGRAKRVYGVNAVGATRDMARATGCSRRALAEIIRKGEGAYYSSGSRPNQTAHSWGIARLASAVTAGKAAAVDFSILQRGCHPKTSKALRLAKRAVRKHGHGTRRVPKIRL